MKIRNKGIVVFLLAFLLCMSSVAILSKTPEAGAVEIKNTYEFSIADFPDGTSALEYYGATTPTWTDAAFTTTPQSIAGITVREPIIILTRRTNLRSSNALTLASPIAADEFDENTYLTFRIFVNFSKSTGYGAIDFRIYGLDSDGSTAESGFKLPAVTQKTWVDVTVPTAQVGTLLSDDGTLKGVKIGCFTTTVVEADGHMWPAGAWMSIDSVSVYTKGTQAALTLASVPDAIYGDTVTLSAEGGTGEGEITYEIAEGGTGTALIAENRLTLTGIGTVKVKAVKEGDDSYQSVESNVITVNVGKFVGNAINWTNTPADVVYSGDMVNFEADATYGSVVYAYRKFDYSRGEYSDEILTVAPSARGKYKVVASVEDTINYNGVVTAESVFLIKASVATENVIFTGIPVPGETVAFQAENIPSGQEVERFEMRTGDGVFETVLENSFIMPDNDISIRVVFKGTLFNLSLADGISYTGTSLAGSAITLFVTAPQGKEVDYFTVDDVKIAGNIFLMPAKNVAVTVTFKELTPSVTPTPTPTPEIVNSDTGSGCGANQEIPTVFFILALLSVTAFIKKHY